MTAATTPAAVGTTHAVSVPVSAGLATLRPLRSGEHAVLDAVFDALSASSRYDRYLTSVRRLNAQQRSALTAIDGHTHIAWLAEVDGHPAAIGRLIRVAPRTAEIAAEVVDAHQGKGLGTALLDTLMTVASVSEIEEVQATVLPSNSRSLRLLRAIGMTLRAEHGLLTGTAPVRLPETPVVERAAIVRLALAARVTVRDDLGRDAAA